jgi:hypothetical protein
MFSPAAILLVMIRHTPEVAAPHFLLAEASKNSALNVPAGAVPLKVLAGRKLYVKSSAQAAADTITKIAVSDKNQPPRCAIEISPLREFIVLKL